MERKIEIIVLLIFMGFAGCKKDITNTPKGDLPKIKQRMFITNGDTLIADYSYDEQGRQIRYQSVSNSSVVLFTHSYAGNKIIRTSSIDGELGGTNVYTLNNESLAIVSEGYDANGQAVSQSTFEYDQNGYQILQSNLQKTWLNGNLIQAGTLFYYYTDKKNTIGLWNEGIFYLGKSSVNLVERISNPNQTSYFYAEFDAQGRVSKFTDQFGVSLYTYY